MKLYELTRQYQEAVNHLEHLLIEGEIDQETVTDTLDGLLGEAEDKALNVGMHVKNLASDIEQVDKVVKEYQAKKNRLEKQYEFYQNYVSRNIEKLGVRKLSNDYCEIGYRKLPDIVVCEEAPPLWCIATYKPDKKAIKAELEQGHKLNFAHLETGRERVYIK